MTKLTHHYNLLILFCSLFLVFRLSSSANLREIDLEMQPVLNPEPGIRYINYDIIRIIQDEVIRINLEEEQSIIQGKQIFFGIYVNFALLYPIHMWNYISIESIVIRILSIIVVLWFFPLYLGYYLSISWPHGSQCPSNFKYKLLRVERNGMRVSQLKWASLAVTWIVEMFCFMPDGVYNSLPIVPPRFLFYIFLAILFAYIMVPISCFNHCLPMQPVIPE